MFMSNAIKLFLLSQSSLSRAKKQLDKEQVAPFAGLFKAQLC